VTYQHLVVEADGASRGNPGPAAGGAVVLDPESGDTLATVGKLCGTASNNVAEYRGMIEGIRAAWGSRTRSLAHCLYGFEVGC